MTDPTAGLADPRVRVSARSLGRSGAIGLGLFAIGGLLTPIGVGLGANWLSHLADSEPGSLGRIFESEPAPLIILAFAVAGVVSLNLGVWLTIRELLKL